MLNQQTFIHYLNILALLAQQIEVSYLRTIFCSPHKRGIVDSTMLALLYKVKKNVAVSIFFLVISKNFQ
jgi:hypothetical protein